MILEVIYGRSVNVISSNILCQPQMHLLACTSGQKYGFVLVLTYLGGWLGVNCPSAILKLSKITRVSCPKNHPNHNVITG